MKKKLYQAKLHVKKSPLHGYGVFAAQNIRKGAVIEECYTIISKGGDRVLEEFYFDANGKHAIPTGFGIIYNHSDDPNADYKVNSKTRIMTYFAEKAIRKGEEIFVSYGEKWFKDRGYKPKKPKVKAKRKRAR